MGWFSDLVDSFTGGGSSNDSEDKGAGQQFNPNVGYATPDTPSQLERESYVGSSDGYVTSGATGERVQSDVSRDIFLEGQRQDEYDAAQRAEEQRRATELERQRALRQQYIDASADAFLGGEGLFAGYDVADPFYNQLAQAGIDFTDVANYGAQGLSSGQPVTFDELQQFDTITGERGFKNVTRVGDKLYGVEEEDLGRMVAKYAGQAVAGQVAPQLIGLGVGTVVNELGTNPYTTAQSAITARTVSSAFQPEINFLMDADGTRYEQFSAYGYNELLTEEEANTRREFNKELAERTASDADAEDIKEILGQGLAIADASGSVSWKDLYGGPDFSLEGLVTDTVKGVAQGKDILSLQYGAELAGGANPVGAAFKIFGDDLNSILPEGYEQPTEAGIRIGLGENRVAVLGDVYGEDFNLDNPLGKAGLKGAEVYDMTGDSDEALQKSVYTYFKEGGKLPDFEAPKFLDGANFNINFGWLKEAGMTAKEMFDFGVNIPELNLDWINLTGEGISFSELPDLGFKVPDLKNIDFGGTKLGDIEGLNLGNLKEYGLEVGDLPDMNIDIDFELGALRKRTGQFIEEEEQFEAIDEEEALADVERSLARELLGMEQTKAVQEKA